MGTNYYVRPGECENPCAHCRAPETIHLGKSSAGWTFSFRAYPDPASSPEGVTWPVADFPSWLKLLDLGKIEDEYGQPVTRDALVAKVEAKRGGQSELSGHDYRDAGGNRFVPGEFS